jgi:Rrf2 family protein
MAGIVQVSDAVAIGLHAALCLSAAPERCWSAREIVARFAVSEAHLAKVLAALARAGVVVSKRGPRGGARLARPPAQITLLEIYEALDGPMRRHACLLAEHGCGRAGCPLGPELAAANDALRAKFATTTLADVAGRGATRKRRVS